MIHIHTPEECCYSGNSRQMLSWLRNLRISVLLFFLFSLSLVGTRACIIVEHKADGIARLRATTDGVTTASVSVHWFIHNSFRNRATLGWWYAIQMSLSIDSSLKSFWILHLIDSVAKFRCRVESIAFISPDRLFGAREIRWRDRFHQCFATDLTLKLFLSRV